VLILRLGWRNLWRNPRRSTLSIAAVAVAFAVLLTVESLGEGMAWQMLDNGTRLLLGHLQVHDGAYLPARGLHDTLGGEGGTDVTALTRSVEGTSGVVAAAPRVFGFGLLSTGPRSAGAQLLGVDAAREARVTRLLDALVAGAGLGGAPPNAVLLGATLAEELGARVGDEVAVVTQAADGSIGNELLTVRGLFRTGLATIDRSLALMAMADLQALMALGERRIHEVAAVVADPRRAEAVATDLAAAGTLPLGTRVKPWPALAPALVEYLRLLRGWSWVMVLIVGVFAALGVANTMLMAVFERTHEIGMLASLGLRPRQVLFMVLAESVCLTAVGLAAGLGLGGLGMAYMTWHGWDLSRWAAGLTIAGVLIDPVLRGVFTWTSTPRIAGMLAAIMVLAALLPAVRAARLRPVEALAAPGQP
jgi:ABC-type lipoprotein release transport system permease subunit